MIYRVPGLMERSGFENCGFNSPVLPGFLYIWSYPDPGISLDGRIRTSDIMAARTAGKGLRIN